MANQDIFNLIQVIVSTASLIVSIVVFLHTVRVSIRERKISLSKEMYHEYLQLLDEFFSIVEIQSFLDEFAVIYGEQAIDYNFEYTKLSRIYGKINNLIQKLALYIPENNNLTTVIQEAIVIIAKKANAIIEVMRTDLNLRNASKESEIELNNVNALLKEYSNCISILSENIYKGLLNLQNVVFDKESLKSENIEAICETLRSLLNDYCN